MIFNAFDSISKKNFAILTVGQAILCLVIWSFSPIDAISTPAEIVVAWHKMATNEGLLYELFVSAATILKAIGLASLISFGLAYLTTAVVFKPVVTWMTSMRFLGFAGITFLFTLWTANSGELKLWLLTFGMTVFLLSSALAIVNSVTQEQIDYARTLQLDGWQITWEIVVRGKLDEAIDVIRQNAAVGWTLLSMVEGLSRSEGGIGAMLLMKGKYLNLDELFAIQLTILAYGILQDYFLRWIRVVVCPYIAKESN